MNLGVFSVLLLIILVSATRNLRGVSPSVLVYYQSETFTCLDGSKTISYDAVNDDYCDCLDASDEPGTSACRNGRFHCQNEGHVSQAIFSSRVNDGICDCCDGTDEYLSSICKNTCKEAWAASTAQTSIDIEEHQKGIAWTQQMQNKYLEDSNQKLLELNTKKETKSNLLPNEDNLKSKKAVLQEKIDKLKEELTQQITAEIEPEVEQQYLAKQLEKAALEAQQAEQQQTEEQQAEEQQTEEPQEEEQEHEEEVPPEEPVLTEEEKQKQIDEEKNNIRKELVDQKVQQNEQLVELNNEMKSIDDELSSISRQVSDLEREMNDIEKFLNFDFGPKARYAYMEGQTYTFNTPEYTYTLKPFKEVTQGHTRVGSWGSWDNDYSVLKFENGERCWGGPDRSIQVTLLCGSDTQILEVKEPNKCEYSMKIKTPGACKSETLQQLYNKLQQ